MCCIKHHNKIFHFEKMIMTFLLLFSFNNNLFLKPNTLHICAYFPLTGFIRLHLWKAISIFFRLNLNCKNKSCRILFQTFETTFFKVLPLRKKSVISFNYDKKNYMRVKVPVTIEVEDIKMFIQMYYRI